MENDKEGVRLTDLDPEKDYVNYYFMDANRKATASALLHFGLRIFDTVLIVKYIDHLKKFTNYSGVLTQKEQQMFATVGLTMLNEKLIDQIKIGILMENYMKAVLISEGYLIHDIVGKYRKEVKAKFPTIPINADAFFAEFPPHEDST